MPESIDRRVKDLLGEVVGKTKNHCVDALLQPNHDQETNDSRGSFKRTRISFPERTGYIEFLDGVALFINAPDDRTSSVGQSRSYPNEWLNDGQVLTWFLRHNEWDDGNSLLASKLMKKDEKRISVEGPDDVTKESVPAIAKPVLLFVRMKRSRMYVFCGHVMVVPPLEKQLDNESSLVKFHLILQDWSTLIGKSNFRRIVEIPYD